MKMKALTARERKSISVEELMQLMMKFSNLVSEFIVNGKQIKGTIAHSKRYISSRKYISADGGFRRIVWMPKVLKEEIGTALNALARTVSVENFVEMIADERDAITEEEVLEYMRKVSHPALEMESMVYRNGK